MSDEKHSYSASQVVAADQCMRMWGWKTLCGIPSPPGAGARLGTAVHKQLEIYMKGGAIDFSDESGEIAQSGIHLLPTPATPDIECEKPFSFIRRYPWRGYIDLWTANGVTDHKTTADFQYALSTAELLDDIQATVYSHVYGRDTSLRWIYYRTRGARRAMCVEATMKREKTEENMEMIEGFVDTLDAHVTASRSLDAEKKREYVLSLPANPSRCDRLGGCSYRGLCNLTPEERFRAFTSKGTKDMSLIAKLRQQTPVPSTTSTSSDIRYSPEFLARPDTPPVSVEVEKYVVNPPESKIEPMPPVVAAEEKPKRGRPKKEAETSASKTEVTAGYILYVDCEPTKNPCMRAEDLYRAAADHLHAEHGLADYRFKGFGEGQGMFVQMVRRLLEERKPPALCVDTRQVESGLCLSHFVNGAVEIVRGR